MPRRAHLTALAGVVVASASALTAAPAQAVTVTVESGVVTVQAQPGEVNKLSVWPSGSTVEVAEESSAPIVAGPGCSVPQRTWRTYVVCDFSGRRADVSLGDGDDYVVLGDDASRSDARFAVLGGEGNDTVNQGEGNVTAYGEAGDDYLFTGAGDDELHGGPGNDQFRADDGDDRLLGGPGYDTMWGEDGADRLEGGDDTDWMYGHDDWGRGESDDDPDVLVGGGGGDRLDGEGGADRLEGGEGADDAWYGGHLAGVTVTLDGQGTDGAAGEGDVIADDVESATGGRGDDVLVGTDGANYLIGGAGADRVEGAGGDDVLMGGVGADTLSAGAGADRLEGGLDGDVLDGGAGADELRGEEGDDRLEARDGAADKQPVDCGTSAGDVGVLDRADESAGCERREYPDAAEQDTPPTPVLGSWSDPMSLVPAGVGAWASAAVVDPGGDVLVSWSEDRADDTFGIAVRAAIARPGLPPESFDLDPAGSGAGAQLAVDGRGTVWASWVRTNGDTMVASRTSGAPRFSAAERVESAGYSTLITNRHGDVAVVSFDRQERRWFARKRPHAGPWGDLLPVSNAGELPAGDPWSWEALLTDSGDVAVMWLHDPTATTSSDAWPVMAAVRDASGAVLPVRRLTSSAFRYASIALAASADGTATLAWQHEIDPASGREGLSVAERRPGLPIGPEQAVPAEGFGVGSAALGVARDGRVTLAFTDGCDRALASGPSARQLSVVKRFGAPMCGGDVALAQSPGGRVTAGWAADPDHRTTVSRSGDEPFGPVQDLRRDCGHVDYFRLATNDTGLAAALATGPDGLSLLRQAPFTGNGLQGCTDARAYAEPVRREPPPAGGGGGPTPPFGPRPGTNAPPPGPPGQPAATTARAGGTLAPVVVGDLTISGRGLRRTASVALRCAERCRASLKATLGPPRGRPLATAKTVARGSSESRRLRLRLRPVRGRARSARLPGDLVLRIRVETTDARGAKSQSTLSRRLGR